MRKIVIISSLLLSLLVADLNGWINFQLDEPFVRLADNSVIDIVSDGTYIWFATGFGISGTNDRGITWRSYNASNSFKRNSISALVADGNRLWVTTAFDSVTETASRQTGGGLHYTDDFGDNWTYVPQPQLTLVNQLSFDLDVYESTLWSASFAGGLIRSLDYGDTWENVFIDTAFITDYESGDPQALGNRYFSVAIDPYHNDTTIIWAGSAAGIQRIFYLSKRIKLAGDKINDLSFDGVDFWLGTNRGLSKLTDFLEGNFRYFNFNTFDSSNGFAGNNISAIGTLDELICAGIYDTTNQQSLGFSISTNDGASWVDETPEQAIGSNQIEEIEVYGNDIWAACGNGGLIHSTDFGISWQNYYLDSLNQSTADLRNVFHSIDLAIRNDLLQLKAGTDSGIVVFDFDESGDLIATNYLEIADQPGDSSFGQKIVSVASVKTDSGEHIWAASHPHKLDIGASPAIILSKDNGLSWIPFLNAEPAVLPYDIEIDTFSLTTDNIIWAATDQGPFKSRDDESFTSFNIFDARDPSITLPRPYPFEAIEVGGKQTMIGSRGLGAVTMLNPIANIMVIHQAQIKPDSFDFVQISDFSSDPEDSTIGGNFIPVLEIQRTGDSSIYWAQTRPTDTGQRNAIAISTNLGRTWRDVMQDVTAWNFGFNGDSVFVAASSGLFFSTDFGTNWEKMKIIELETGNEISEDAEVYSTAVIDGFLWVGTSDGLAVTEDGLDWDIFRSFVDLDSTATEEDRSYVTPSPYSPYNEDTPMRLHYLLQNAGNVTITIYDFTNNIVKVIADNQPREANIQYDEEDFWDGKNGNGDIVAAGVYIYLIESSSGEKLWGKFMVIP